MAVDFEVKHRIEGEDFRRQMFAKQEELLELLNDNWKHREEKDHQWILKSHPFEDNASIRADYSKQLRDQGMSDMDAWTEACKRYPEPKAG